MDIRYTNTNIWEALGLIVREHTFEKVYEFFGV